MTVIIRLIFETNQSAVIEKNKKSKKKKKKHNRLLKTHISKEFKSSLHILNIQ